MKALYAHDFADRQVSLTAQVPGHPDQLVASGAVYEPSGPLAALSLGNGLGELRAQSQRYFPDRISLGGASTVLDWDYTTDAVGNIASIADLLNAANDRSYTYQDHQYYLETAVGPWGDLGWSYDQIGNRMTETRDGLSPDLYFYVQNGGGKNTAILDHIQLGLGGTRSYTYGPAGHLEEVDSGGNLVRFVSADDGRLVGLERPAGDARTGFTYDGRSFLSLAEPGSITGIFTDGFETGDASCWTLQVENLSSPAERSAQGSALGSCGGPLTEPIYSSDGVLHSLLKTGGPGQVSENRHVLYIAGRPVVQLDLDEAGVPSYGYLTTDHLGTPVAVTDQAGTVVWQGGFEPFGADFSGAEAAGVSLRLPGQWSDDSWEEASEGVEGYYNVHRWYTPTIGSYTRPDPVVADPSLSTYLFGSGRPTRYFDPLGLYIIDGSCRCPAIDPPFSPDSPNETPAGLNVADLQFGVDDWCGLRVFYEIIDPELRECIQNSCDTGKIKCKDDCDVEKMVGFNVKVPFLKNKTARVCTNAPPWHLTPASLGDTVIHEWAHGCGWDHGDAGGVPGDPGR